MKTFLKLWAIAFALFLTGTQAKANDVSNFDFQNQIVSSFETLSVDQTQTQVALLDLAEVGDPVKCTVQVSGTINFMGSSLTVSVKAEGDCESISDQFNAKWSAAVRDVRNGLRNNK